MKRALLNLLRVVMLIRHILPVFLFALASLNTMAQCPAPVTATPASANICAGDSVLMESTDAAASTFQWYKDGVIMPDSVKRTCYAREAGNYTVTTDVCGTPSTSVNITIKPLPVLSIAVSSLLLCSGQEVTLTVNQGPNVVWAWIAPLSNAWTSTNPLTVTLTTPTTFQLVGANQITQCANTVAVTVNVIPPLNPGTLHSNSQVCPGGTPPLITSDPATGGSGSYTYQWQMSTTSATTGFVVIPGATSQNYQPPATSVTTWYRMIVFSPPCDPENSNAVVVQVDEIPTVTSAPTKAICTGDNVNYHPTSNVPNTTYTWTASATAGSVSGFTASGSGNINDVLEILPFGSAIQGEVTYVITPRGPGSSFCTGTPPFKFVVTVYPLALVTNAVLSQDICAGGTTTPVVFQSNIPGATYSWNATGTGGLSGFQNSGTGNLPAMTISGLLSGAGTVKYTITPHLAGSTCPTGPSVEYIINVNPAPSVTNNPMQQTICTGDKSSLVTLVSNIAGTTFTWTATASSGISGFQASGTNTIPIQTITNTSNVQGTVAYHIVPNPSTNGCPGVPRDYSIIVNPEPVLTVPQLSYTVCSGTSVTIPLSSNVAGTQYTWSANSGGVITGGSDQLVPISTSEIIQTLTNTSNANHNITYVITPTINGCDGTPVTVTVTVTPEQVLSIVPVSPVTCSGNNVVISLVGNVPGITFTWTASSTGNVTGFSNGAGSVISQTLTNHDNVTRTVVYSVIMTLNGCSSGVKNFNVTVYPNATITNNPLSASQCSGSTFNLALSSSVAGSIFSWTANSTPGVSGYSSGNGSTINQQISNSTSVPAAVVYTITPTSDGCLGTPSDYTLTANPIPDVNLSLSSQSICSGTATTQIDFSSAVAGTTYSWTAVPSGAGISGYLASGTTAFIPTQTINSNLTTQGTVTYSVIPAFSGCTGPSASHIATINPLPQVTNGSMAQTICTGATSASVILLSDVAGTSFTWTATASSGAITGFLANGSNTIPAQTIFNSTATPGTVTYHIIPTSNFGPNCPGTPATYTITVSPSPTITSSLNEAVCSGQPFSYTITADLPGTTFTWSRAVVSGINNSAAFGTSDNFTETLLNPTLTDIDVYYVITPKSQAPSLCPGAPVTLIVKVRALPQVNAGADLTIPYGINTSLNGIISGGTGALSPTWTPNAYIAAGANTLIPQTTNLTLTRTYTLSVEDAAGCTASDEMMVIVVGTPLAAVPISSPTDVCFGTSAIINANATGGSGSYTYSWTSIPAGFTSTLSTITVTPLVNTQYILTVNDGFNTTSATVTTTVNPLPLNFVLTGGGSYCIGESGVIVGLAGSQTGVEYQLFNNGNPVGSHLSGNDASISFGNQTLAGIYTVTATRVSTSCTQGMNSTVSVSINSLPVADAGVDQNIPFGTSTLLNGSVSGGFGIMNYSWNPTAFIASGNNSSSAITSNLYSNTTFSLEVTDANGCKGTDDVVVLLDGNAISVTTNSNPAQICADASQAQLNAIVTGGTGVYTYLWTCIPAGSPVWTSTEQNPLVSPDVNTIYTVTANDGFNSAIASATVVVNPLPLVYSVTGSNSYCYAGSGVTIGLSGSQPNTNYQLFRGGVADGPAVTGDGNPISFGNRTAAFIYDVIATNNITGCTNYMNGSATIIILSPPPAFLITGGGSYPIGGPGRVIGLMHGDSGMSYQLYCENVPVGYPVAGTDAPVDFGLQTLHGTYTVVATDIATGCTASMTGSVEITILAAPSIFAVTGGGIICENEPGLMVGLSGSEAGIDYQLIFAGFPMGSVQAGTNSPLFWGPFTTSGLYEVRAVNPVYSTTQMMNDSAVIIVNPLPTIFTVNPTGSQCPGTIIRLNGSDPGIVYSLLLNGVSVDTQTGTGIVGFLDFGPRTMTGTYTIKAVNPITGCEAMMNGSTFINIPPQIYNIIPAGILCPGQEIRIAKSETGVNYQLRWNGTFDLGAPVAGTGSDISMGNAGLPGIYSVVAIDATTNCVSYMNDSATLYPDPTAFTIVPNGEACEDDLIGQNGSELGVDYVLLLDNAIHVDTISGTGMPISFGPQLTAGAYTIMAVNQFSYCIFNMSGTAVMNDSPIKYNILPAGIQCIGNSVALSASQPGVTYQLMLNSIYNMGLPVAGTGNIIDFGPQSLTGIYTVRAVNNVTGCYSMMANSTVLDALPVVFTTLPAGSHCAGTIVGIDDSELNFNYILILDGSIHLDTIAGTGNPIDFGAQVTAGTYSVVAYNATTFCSAPMNSSSLIEASPVGFNMTPAGSACIGASLGLENSETGITYQLRWNGTINVGAPVAGTGSAITLGTHNLTGTYSVVATNNNGCATTMSSSVIINPLPVAFNVIPSGIQCQGTVLGLDGSEVNANYILVLNGNVLTDTISGTGSIISFGPQMTSGEYTVLAYFTATNCQSVMNGSSQISNVAPTIYSMTPAGIICAGAIIGLDNSETGAFYQLRLNGTINMGAPIAGTGSPISFGAQTVPGIYTAIATNADGCNSLMAGKVEMNPNPTPFTINPNGIRCPGTAIGTDGSEAGVNYILQLNGAINIDTLAGTGSPLSFDVQTTSGTYTVIAYNSTSLCHTTMNGSTFLNPAPIAFDLTPAGISCTGISIGVEDSETGVLYQLRRNGTINIGTPVAGTGSAISFGTQTVPGTYTVEAAGSNGCTSMMSSSVIVNPTPVAYTLFPAASHCPGTVVTLNGSEVGINYVLLRDGIFPMDTLGGTGSTLSFGEQMIAGTYMVAAFSSAASCPAIMNGTTTILTDPTPFNVTPAGMICSGNIVGLEDSELGVTYQLRRDGTTNIGVPAAGTGSAISFGTINMAGEYSVIATNSASGCAIFMSGTAVLQPIPLSYNITPAGSQCAGTSVTLNGSQTNIDYVLIRDNAFKIDTIAGTGSVLDFGPQYVSGNYTVTAIVGASACQNLMKGITHIMALPFAKFSYIAESCHNGTIIFSDESISTPSVITGWNWEFAPGVYSTLQNPSITFDSSGICYDVKLTVTTSNGCSNTVIQQVCIPSGNEVTMNYTQGCFGETTYFSSSFVSPSGNSTVSYNWNFGDPATGFNNESKLANPQHTFSKPGTYFVSLKATDEKNCSTSKYISITVDALPQADFSYDGGTCDSLVRFTDITTGTKIARWIWNFGDGKSKIIDAPASPNANHYYTYPGVYEVTLITQSEAGCSDTIKKTIHRTPCIAADFKVSDPVVCVNRSMKFTESSTCQAPISSWTWYFGDNTSVTFTSPQQNVEHTYAVPGNYTVTMVVATQMVGGAATDTASNQVSVKPAAKASYSWQDVCVGTSTTFDNLSQNNNTIIKSYLWNFGDPGSLSDTTSSKNAEYRYDVFGEYEVKLVVTNTFGCTDTIINKINIFESPLADFKWDNSCEARPVFFIDHSEATSSNIVKWNWKFSNAGEILEGSDQRNCSYSFAKAGVYSADMTITDLNGCSTSINKQVTINPNPVAAFSIIENYENKQGQIMISNGSIHGTFNEWDISNGKTTSATNPVITFDKEGHYTIRLTTWSDQNCVDTISMEYDLMYKGLYVPNAFSPGHIDPEVAVFKPKGTNLKMYNVGVYDRWGNLLWSSDKIDEKGSPAESWDGTLHGELLKQDVYVWKITAQFKDDEVWDGTNTGNNENMPQLKAGTVTLIR